MQVLFDVPDEVSVVEGECKRLLKETLASLATQPEQVKVSGGIDVFSEAEHQGKIFLLTEGAVHCSVGGRTLYLCDEGDLIGLESEMSYHTDFAVIVDAFDRNAFLQAVDSSGDARKLWGEYLQARLTLHALLCSAALKSDLKFEPEVKMFLPGDTIVEQGDTSTEVFTLAEGKAEVFVDEVKVGDVFKDEIFGAIAALTNTPRTASVVAEQSCMVMSLDKESFIELIRGRPATVNKLVSDMAGKIVSLNERVVKLEQGNE